MAFLLPVSIYELWKHWDELKDEGEHLIENSDSEIKSLLGGLWTQAKNYLLGFLELESTLTLGVGTLALIYFSGPFVSFGEEMLTAGYDFVWYGIDFLSAASRTSKAVWTLLVGSVFALFFTQSSILLMEKELNESESAFFWRVYNFYTIWITRLEEYTISQFGGRVSFIQYFIRAVFWVPKFLVFLLLCLLNLLNPWHWID